MSIYYVYAYLRKSDGIPYYIGKGKGNRAYDKHNGTGVPKDKSKIIFLERNLEEDVAFAKEIEYIKKYGRQDLGTGVLLNRTDGGDSGPRMIGKENPFYGRGPMFGKTPSKKHRQKLRESNINKKRSEEAKLKMSLAKIGSKHSDETKAKMKNSRRNFYWWNNGVVATRNPICPGSGWLRGGLKRKKK